MTTAGLGTFLTDGFSRTLYAYKSDQSGDPPTSACTGDCASSWPPFTVDPGTRVTAASDVSGAITTFTRPDGTVQVAYNGMPLYYCISDHFGTMNGQGHDGLWFIVQP